MSCAVEDCLRTDIQGRGWCQMHYYRWRRHGDPEAVRGVRYRSDQECLIDGCKRTDIRAHGWCGLHYSRWRFTGDAEREPERRNERSALPEFCEVEGCDKPTKKRARMCSMHVARVARHGDPAAFINPTDRAIPSGPNSPKWLAPEEVTYNAVHLRVKRLRGSATKFPCVSCGGLSRHWGYDHSDPDEKQSKYGPYSPDVSRYHPMCASCHKYLDLAQRASA